MSWDQAVGVVGPHVVKIETPSGYGTGFLTLYNDDGTWCGIATAAHVVSHADDWQEPIRIVHQETEVPRFLKADDRVIVLDRATDSAIVIFLKGHLNLPEVPIALLPMDQPCSIGLDVGWLGFPAIDSGTLCFFAGAISARQANRKSYLIDGVAINGVSGGPVFHCPSPGDPRDVQIIGCVSVYHANRATGEALPGLLRAQDVSHFHWVANRVRSIDEAKAKKREFEATHAPQAQLGQSQSAAPNAEPPA
jgi:hypothetical protein